ncbi:MAG: hypothetical protein K1W21_02190 [Oscillospiraceae bacterium]
MFENCEHAQREALFPPCFANFPWNTQSIPASNRLRPAKNRSPPGIFPIFKQHLTAQYVDVRLERKKAVLKTYHKALYPQKAAPEKGAASKNTPKKTKKRSSELEL